MQQTQRDSEALPISGWWQPPRYRQELLALDIESSQLNECAEEVPMARHRTTVSRELLRPQSDLGESSAPILVAAHWQPFVMPALEFEKAINTVGVIGSNMLISPAMTPSPKGASEVLADRCACSSGPVSDCA
jgi:hypothetical protein